MRIHSYSQNLQSHSHCITSVLLFDAAVQLVLSELLTTASETCVLNENDVSGMDASPAAYWLGQNNSASKTESILANLNTMSK